MPHGEQFAVQKNRGVRIPHRQLDPLTNGKKTRTDFYVGPGVSALYTMKAFFFGGDMRILKLTGDGASAFSVLATGGLRF